MREKSDILVMNLTGKCVNSIWVSLMAVGC